MQRVNICLLSVNPLFAAVAVAAASIVHILDEDCIIITTTSCTQCSNIHSTVNAFAAYYLCVCVCVGYYYCFDCPCATNTRLVPSICKSTSCGDHRTQLLDTRLLVSTSVSQRNDIFERTLCANVPSIFVYYYLIFVVVYEF